MNTIKKFLKEKDIQIDYLEEKLWIMLYFLKRQKKFEKEKLLKTWQGWWAKDFIDENGKPLQIYNSKLCKKATKNERKQGLNICEDKDQLLDLMLDWILTNLYMPLEEIKKKRLQHRYQKVIPKNIQKQAEKNGYIIRKGSASKHPFRVSGFQVISAKNPKKIIAGNKFDLTFKEVCEFCTI